jgi:branched-chain amino acid transport system ATP-binding protein
MADALLEVKDLHGWYGESHVLHGMSFSVPAGEVVTLLGRNGAGKTTTMRAVMGMLPKRKGSVRYESTETVGLASNLIARHGIGYVPEERGIFSSLSVRENLELPPVVKPGGMSVDEVHQLFPRLKERASSQGTKLSGGEQQMLAISRALMLRPRLLLLDEPSFGLAPLIVAEIFRIMRRINEEEKVSMLLVEQNANIALDVAHHAYLLETGRIAVSGPSAQIKNDETIRRVYLGY